jgi:DNA polymerase
MVYWDDETFSAVNLKERGAHNYAADPSTGVHFFCFAVDDGDVQTWRPGDAVPEPFANPGDYKFIAHNWLFENAILRHVLIPRYGFKPIPWENQDCAMRLALASAYPAELGLCCEALGLPYKKDPAARAAMLRLAKPPAKKPKDPAQRERDLVLLLERCKRDVEATRAVHRSPLLRALPQERAQLILDARVNETGMCSNVPFLEAIRDLSAKERNAVNVRLNELTEGDITSADQVARIKEALAARGHSMPSLGKRAVAAALKQDPDAYVFELLRLRQQASHASVRTAKRLLGYSDPTDRRIRGALRFCGAGTARWSSPGPQLHNLNRNGDKIPGHLIEAVLAGDRAALARYGAPLAVAAGLMRAVLCARPGHVLICADFGAIESRVLAWFAGEVWKLDAYRQYDATGNKTIEPYRITAAKMLNKTPQDIGKPERQLGKSAELACGFGGSVGAWRRIAPGGDEGRSDADILAIVKQWRSAHPQIRTFWYDLADIAQAAIRDRGAYIIGGRGVEPAVTAAFDGYALTLTLPSGRAINYPGAKLVPNRKFEDGAPDIEYFDNARGQWKPVRAWFGVLVENVVQSTARDLLAAALLRFAARGWTVVFHCHDEIVIEAPEGALDPQEVLAVMLEPPRWAVGLPLAGSVHAGALYFEEPDAKEAAQPLLADAVERDVEDLIVSAEPLPETRETERDADKAFVSSLDGLDGLGATMAPLTDLVTLPMDAGNRVSCPFHDDPNPSCRIYPDHFYCFGCGEHGDRVTWLTKVEGMTRAEALAVLQDWAPSATAAGATASAVARERPDTDARRERALGWWDEATPLKGTIAERYLAETRGIDTAALPPSIHDALRFHRWCPFASGAHPCLIALMRDPLTDEPVGVQRVALAHANGAVTKIERRAFGGLGAVKLWPLNGGDLLVAGEGIETVLAAATRIPWRGAPLVPAWSAINSNGLASLPPISGVTRLVVLVDNDENEAGQKAMEQCRQSWTAHGRQVVPLKPKQRGWDFNDLIVGRKL